MGLMQIMPKTWNELRRRYGLGHDPWQPRANILAGAAYLREMHDRYGSMAAMLAAYNAGPRRYDAHLASGRALPAETVAYVAKIAAMIDGKVPVMRLAGAASRILVAGRSSSSIGHQTRFGGGRSSFRSTINAPRSSICRRSCRRPMASSCEGRARMENSDEHRVSTLRDVGNRRYGERQRGRSDSNRRKAR